MFKLALRKHQNPQLQPPDFLGLDFCTPHAPIDTVNAIIAIIANIRPIIFFDIIKRKYVFQLNIRPLYPQKIIHDLFKHYRLCQ
jgi:hypothetical protein